LVAPDGVATSLDLAGDDYFDGDKVEMQSATDFEELCKRPLY
jgi:hypothetical protein